MNPKNIETTPEFEVHLVLPNLALARFTTQSQQVAQELVSSVIKDLRSISMQDRNKPVEFETGDSGTVLIFHESYEQKQKPLGWITESEVPAQLSLRNLAARTLQKAA